MTHTDIVFNDWANARQQRMARVVDAGAVVSDDPAWVERLTGMSPQEASEKYRHGAYIEATEPHEPDACPFRDGDLLKMTVHHVRPR